MRTVDKQKICQVKDLGVIDYEDAYGTQKQTVNTLLQGGDQVLLLCEHPATLTLGRSADESHLLISREKIISRGMDIHHIDRGGDITLHAPGQLICYPILNLANFGKDLRFYMRQLEQVTIDLLGEFGIVASRFPGQTGVWTGTQKIASIGIGVRKWVSFHGLAINVSTHLEFFSVIKPCGLNVQMTSMSQVKGETIGIEEVKVKIIKHFCRVFSLKQKGS